MAVTRAQLRYNISSWQQLSQCLSNISNEYHIRTKQAVGSDLNGKKLNGTVIEVYHDHLGTLFTYLVEADGDLITNRASNSTDMSVSRLLDELSRFGFVVTFNRKAYLSDNQIEYLETLKGLNYDKLRWLYVYSYNSAGAKVTSPHIVAFNVDKQSMWLDNGYTASEAEFLSALADGSAINIDEISKAQTYRWDWLDFVASIEDVLEDNQKDNKLESAEDSYYTKAEIDKLLESYYTKSQIDNIVGRNEYI